MNTIQRSIVVVIPAYKAQAHIAEVIATIPDWIAQIIVIEDGSPDATADVVSRLAESDPRVHLIRHAANQGVGGAVLSGYQAAIEQGAEIIVKMDSDGQMDPDFILPLVQPILQGAADYTKGNRFLHATALKSMPLLRQIGNLALSFLLKLASGYWNIFDPTNGFTAIHTSLIQWLDPGKIDRRYFFESSLLIELGILRAAVKDVYIPARYGNETSSLSEIASLFEFPPKLIRGMLRRLIIQYFLRDFTAFSILLVTGIAMGVFGIIWGGFHWWRSIQSGIPATTGTVMLAVLPLILGIQFLLQALQQDIQNVPTQPIHNKQERIPKNSHG